MKYKITIVGFQTFEIESNRKIKDIIQAYYEVPIFLTETEDTNYHISVENIEDNTTTYYMVAVNDLKEALYWLYSISDISIKESNNAEYLYANSFSILHTNTDIKIETNYNKPIPSMYSKQLYQLPKLVCVDINIEHYIEEYNNLCDKYSKLYIKFTKETPVFNADYLSYILDLFSATKLYFKEDFKLNTPCYIFLNDNINSAFYFMLLPIDYRDDNKVGFICQNVTVNVRGITNE